MDIQIKEIFNNAKPNELRELLANHFKPTNEERIAHAEFSTPIKLVDDMLDKIPNEFWTKPHKVFEPCCGKGNFVIAIFDRFFKGLENMIPDPIERSNVIINDCLYYADINPLNVSITTEIIGYRATFFKSSFNSYIGDTLKLDIVNKWNIEGFDAIIGNPPYNIAGKYNTGNTIWQHFVKLSIKYILPNGYIVFVHPPGWRKPNTENCRMYGLYDIMVKNNQMLYLEIHNKKDGKKTFGSGTRYDIYIIQKTLPYKNTIVIDEYGIKLELYLPNFSWLPNSNILEVQKLLAKDDDEKCNVICSRYAYESRKLWMSKTQTNEFRFTCVRATLHKGTQFMYSKINNRGHFDIPKVIFGDGGINKPVIDIEGKYGMTEHVIGIQIDNLEEGDLISQALQSSKFKTILESCKFSLFGIDWNLFKYFKRNFYKQFI